MRRPLFHWALILTVIAIPPAFRSPVTMGLVAVSFLLTVKSLPAAGWIYPAVASMAAALYFPWLSRLALVERITACVVLAYALWMLGLLVRRGKSLMTVRLGLRQLDYELPLFNLAAVVGLAAFLLKFGGGLEQGTQWTARAWVPLALSPLALGMVRARPRPEFVHVSLIFLVWGVVSVIAPSLSDPHFLALALVVCAWDCKCPTWRFDPTSKFSAIAWEFKGGASAPFSARGGSAWECSAAYSPLPWF